MPLILFMNCLVWFILSTVLADASDCRKKSHRKKSHRKKKSQEKKSQGKKVTGKKVTGKKSHNSNLRLFLDM